MKLLLGLNGERPPSRIVHHFEGVGLVRGEYLCRQANAWVTTAQWRKFTSGYLREISRQFCGRPVWYRMIDMESNEVSTLSGCTDYIVEKTTLLGARGVRRALRLRDELACELGMFTHVANEHDNLNLLLPFVSDAGEVAEIAEYCRALGFRNRLGTMAETPAAMLTLSEMVSAGAQEIVIGLNDLTSLTVGSTRQSASYRKDHPAVGLLVRGAVAACLQLRTPLHAAGYLFAKDLCFLRDWGVGSAIVQYSHLGRLDPGRFSGLDGTLDLMAIMNAVRAKLHDPPIKDDALT